MTLHDKCILKCADSVRRVIMHRLIDVQSASQTNNVGVIRKKKKQKCSNYVTTYNFTSK